VEKEMAMRKSEEEQYMMALRSRPVCAAAEAVMREEAAEEHGESSSSDSDLDAEAYEAYAAYEAYGA